MAQKLAAGNWKMNGLAASLAEAEALAKAFPAPGCDILICPPATLLSRLAETLSDSAITVGGQDCHPASNGAHTGDVSAGMLRDAGASSVILGHSERRADHGETDALVAEKAISAWAAGLVAIICVGETEAERDAGDTLRVINAQLAGSIPDGVSVSNTVVAYEPVWAIGTGRTPTLEQIAEVHDAIRTTLGTRFGGEIADAITLLYGGSVKPGNASDIFAVSNVDGGLVGGASLKAADFGGIVSALETA
ncbi:MAG: triose-phosphate isomerase [Pseudomonadota bacterium]